jgi:hypothetical protein
MNILTYINILVNNKASALIYVNKCMFFLNFLRIAHYFIKLKKGSSPIQEEPLPRLYIKLLFVELIKKAYDKPKNL